MHASLPTGNGGTLLLPRRLDFRFAGAVSRFLDLGARELSSNVQTQRAAKACHCNPALASILPAPNGHVNVDSERCQILLQAGRQLDQRRTRDADETNQHEVAAGFLERANFGDSRFQKINPDLKLWRKRVTFVPAGQLLFPTAPFVQVVANSLGVAAMPTAVGLNSERRSYVRRVEVVSRHNQTDAACESAIGWVLGHAG